jgi:dihydroxyacetone kinase
MPGFSVTLLLLPQHGDGTITKTKILQLLDAPAKTPAWTWTSNLPPKSSNPAPSHSSSGELGETETGNNAPASNQFTESVRHACNALIQAEPEITQMDQVFPEPFALAHVLNMVEDCR